MPHDWEIAKKNAQNQPALGGTWDENKKKKIRTGGKEKAKTGKAPCIKKQNKKKQIKGG